MTALVNLWQRWRDWRAYRRSNRDRLTVSVDARWDYLARYWHPDW